MFCIPLPILEHPRPSLYYVILFQIGKYNLVICSINKKYFKKYV
jgi:hypothetical protein